MQLNVGDKVKHKTEGNAVVAKIVSQERTTGKRTPTTIDTRVVALLFSDRPKLYYVAQVDSLQAVG